jgi:hypothetical protein
MKFTSVPCYKWKRNMWRWTLPLSWLNIHFTYKIQRSRETLWCVLASVWCALKNIHSWLMFFATKLHSQKSCFEYISMLSCFEGIQLASIPRGVKIYYTHSNMKQHLHPENLFHKFLNVLAYLINSSLRVSLMQPTDRNCIF